MGDAFFVVGLVCLWTVAVIFVLAIVSANGRGDIHWRDERQE